MDASSTTTITAVAAVSGSGDGIAVRIDKKLKNHDDKSWFLKIKIRGLKIVVF